MAKRKNAYPDWAEKYRGKGRTIRKTKNGFALYECTTEYVKGARYPRLIQKYLGVITEKDGFMPKSSDSPSPAYLEYGLSRMLRENFRREAMRHTFSFSDDVFRLGIIHFIFGDASDEYLRSSFLTYAESERLSTLRNGLKEGRVRKMSELIARAFEERIPDSAERGMVRNLLMLCVREAGPRSKAPQVPEAVIGSLDRHGMKYTG